MIEIPIEKYLTSLGLAPGDHIRSAEAFNVRAIDMQGNELLIAPLTPSGLANVMADDNKMYAGEISNWEVKEIPQVGEVWMFGDYGHLITKNFNSDSDVFGTAWISKLNGGIRESLMPLISLEHKATETETIGFFEMLKKNSWENTSQDFMVALSNHLRQ